MSKKLTPIERQIVAKRREKRVQYLPSFHTALSGRGNNDQELAYVMLCALQIIALALSIAFFCSGYPLVAIPLFFGIPVILNTAGSISWIKRNADQTNKLSRKILAYNDFYSHASRQPGHDFYGLCTRVENEVGKREDEPLVRELTELCGQITLDALAFPSWENITPEDKVDREKWLAGRYDEASGLADAIEAHHKEMMQSSADEKSRTNLVVSRELMKGLRQKEAVREELRKQDQEPVSTLTRRLSELTSELETARTTCNDEVQKLLTNKSSDTTSVVKLKK